MIGDLFSCALLTYPAEEINNVRLPTKDDSIEDLPSLSYSGPSLGGAEAGPVITLLELFLGV